MKHDPKVPPEQRQLTVLGEPFNVNVLKTGHRRFTAVGECLGQVIRAPAAQSVNQALEKWRFLAIGKIDAAKSREQRKIDAGTGT